MTEHISGRANVFDKVEILEEHAHGQAKVYPTLAAGLDVLSGAVWTLGDFVELIPINTIDVDFDIHWMVLENVTDDETYELVFYNVETEMSRIRFSADNAAGNRITMSPVPVMMGIQKANSQIQVKLASSGDAETATISITYHTY